MSDLCRVLVVDDELLTRQGIRHLLNWEQHGYEIVGEAANGREALEMIERLKPHIVITDVVMPVMDGEELVRIMRSHYPHIEVVVISSYGEYQYVRSTFQSGVADYILKPRLETDELLNVLRRTAGKIPGMHMQMRNPEELAMVDTDQLLDSVLERLLAGYEVDDAVLDEALHAAGLSYDSYVLIGADLRRLPGHAHGLSTALADQVREWLREASYSSAARWLRAPDEAHQMLMLVNMPGDDYLKLVYDAGRLAEQKSAVMPELTWVISDPFDDLRQLSEVYREGWLKQLSYQFYFPARMLASSRDLPPAPTSPWQEPDPKQLLADIRRGQISSAFARIRDSLGQASAHYTTSPFTLKSKLSNLVFHAALGLSESAVRCLSSDRLEEMKYAAFRSIDQARDVEEAIASVEAFLRNLEAAGIENGAADDKLQRLLAYIDEHYSEPLRLSTLSEHFHFHPSYLSEYFSTHHAEGFSEYLNKTRINKARDMLQDAELTISEIGAKVGYPDHSYFTKVFKKYTGMSPSEYRRMMRNRR